MSSLCERECIERAGRCAEMPLRQMQVDCGDLEVSMAEQYLDSAQIGAGFKKMCSEAMSQECADECACSLGRPVQRRSGRPSRGPWW